MGNKMKLHDLSKLDNSIEVIGRSDNNIIKVLPLLSNSHMQDTITWCSLKNIELLHRIHNTNIIIEKTVKVNEINNHCNYILCNNPRRLFQLMIISFFVPETEKIIAHSAKIASTVQLGENISIGENVVIEDGCIIGDNVVIDHGTVIKRKTQIGNYVTVGCNCVIGGCGCGYEKNESEMYELIPHIGNVILEDYIEIGQNNCIDRAVLGSTIVHKNVKTDNHVHIAHGVEIGENTILTAHVMIAGSTRIGQNVWVGPSVAIINNVKIGNGAYIGLGAVVIRDVLDNTVVVGNPAKELVKKE